MIGYRYKEGEPMDFSHCTLCPRACGANRLLGAGPCGGALLPKVALAAVHRGEEPPIVGTRGSGAVFFSGCNMACLFCQNHTISAEGVGKEISAAQLADVFLKLQAQGVHNINLVSAGHFLPQAAQALRLAKTRGLTLPVVYNTNGYETVESLKELEGLVDIYLPDLKYTDDALARAYSRAPGYFAVATAAISEMARQVGGNRLDEAGLLQKGLIVRHLVLPGAKEDSKRVLDWLRQTLGPDVTVSLLRQYTPLYRAKEVKALNRRVTTYEYEAVLDHFFAIGLSKGFMQEKSAATDAEVPVFDLRGL